jgi:hypothetical protein
MSLVKPLPCTEQFGERGHQWKSAVPPSLSEATHGPWHEMSNRLSSAATFPAKRQITEEKITMKAIVVTDQAAGTAGMKLVERPEPQAAINDVVVQVHASSHQPVRPRCDLVRLILQVRHRGQNSKLK